MERLTDFARKNPGRQIEATFRVVPSEPSRAMVGKYYKGLVPQFRQAYLEEIGHNYDNEKVDLELRKLCPVTNKKEFDIDSSQWKSTLLEIHELGTEDLKELFLYLSLLAAEDFKFSLDI